jgi:hypothetical protein
MANWIRIGTNHLIDLDRVVGLVKHGAGDVLLIFEGTNKPADEPIVSGEEATALWRFFKDRAKTASKLGSGHIGTH